MVWNIFLLLNMLQYHVRGKSMKKLKDNEERICIACERNHESKLRKKINFSVWILFSVVSLSQNFFIRILIYLFILFICYKGMNTWMNEYLPVQIPHLLRYDCKVLHFYTEMNVNISAHICMCLLNIFALLKVFVFLWTIFLFPKHFINKLTKKLYSVAVNPPTK